MKKKQRILISPTPNSDSGMYIYNLAKSLSEYFDIVNYGNKREPAPRELFRYLFRADIFLLNWIENEPNKTNGSIRYYMVQVFLTVAKLLNKKIIWTFHNLEPHNKKSKGKSTRLMNRLKNKSDLIVHHTRESLHLSNKEKNFCFFHPFEIPNQFEPLNAAIGYKYDILIWGGISPYKGVAEFLEFLNTDSYLGELKVLIAGKVRNREYEERLYKSLSKNVEFHNKFYTDEELAILHKQSKYVFFSYSGASVLNSGQLVVSLGHSANIIGPNKGAFKELFERELLFTYESYGEVTDIIKKGSLADTKKQEQFINEHSWSEFANAFYQKTKTV